ncbi:hypothetical protein C5S39_00425 [Candidatus Methanophagaceae archaeon]|jgi:hypothetical protein|nr:hypothetical protein C5S39_00425 [Methanophagales archaeon]
MLQTRNGCITSQILPKKRSTINSYLWLSMLKLQKKYHDARMDRDKELYERQIKMVDAQIDRLVYDLYGLTEEEIGIVEGKG